MKLNDYRKQLTELRNIITNGIAYFSVWYRIANLNDRSAHALNRYRGFFKPAQLSLNEMFLLQFAKVFDRDPRTVSLYNLLSAAKNNPKLLAPYAKEQDLQNLEIKISDNDELLSHLKSYRNQRLAHHDQVVSRDTSLPFGQVRQLIDDVKDMYNSLCNWHDGSTTSFDFLSREAERHTLKVIEIMCDERDRARLRIKEANRRIGKGGTLK